MKPVDFRPPGCAQCAQGTDLDFDFTLAFQPIVDLHQRTIHSYEALARMPGTDSAGPVFAHVNESNQYRFDQVCRVKAIKLAAELQIPTLVNINFLPTAIYQPARCLRTTLEAAKTYQFPIERIVFEFTENLEVKNHDHINNIVDHYRDQGFKTAMDDFGAGYSGLSLLADINVDKIKLDRALIIAIHNQPKRQIMIKHLCRMAAELNIEVTAEGVEQYEELSCLADLGVRYFQGFYFARPQIEALPVVDERCFIL